MIFGLWWLTALSTMFHYFMAVCVASEETDKTTYLTSHEQTFSHIIFNSLRHRQIINNYVLHYAKS